MSACPLEFAAELIIRSAPIGEPASGLQRHTVYCRCKPQMGRPSRLSVLWMQAPLAADQGGGRVGFSEVAGGVTRSARPLLEELVSVCVWRRSLRYQLNPNLESDTNADEAMF